MQYRKTRPPKRSRRWCLWCKTEDAQVGLQPCAICQKYARTGTNPARRRRVSR